MFSLVLVRLHPNEDTIFWQCKTRVIEHITKKEKLRKRGVCKRRLKGRGTAVFN